MRLSLYRARIARPPQIPAENFSEHGKTAGLLLRLTESIHHSGRVVIMDSSFCVLLALVKLASFGVYSSAVIKKHRYWLKYIDGSNINVHFDFKEVGQTESLPGTLDGTEFKVICMEEQDYVMKLMATYGALRSIDEGATQRSVTRRNGIRENVSLVSTPKTGKSVCLPSLLPWWRSRIHDWPTNILLSLIRSANCNSEECWQRS